MKLNELDISPSTILKRKKETTLSMQLVFPFIPLLKNCLGDAQKSG